MTISCRRALEAPVEPRESLPRRVLPSVLAAIGETPMVTLSRYLDEGRLTIFAKLEGLNPGGSLKDRPARRILEAALASGRIGADSVVVESSSGNMGIGLAQACRYHGLRFICVVDPKTTAANLEILRVYGAEVDCVAEPDSATGEFLQARLKRVEELVASIPGAFWPNQYANHDNAASHYDTTMDEILRDCGEVDYLLVATSTCGTLLGCAEHLRDKGYRTKVIAVDAVGSLIFGSEGGKRLLPGMGASLRPPLCAPELVHRVIQVTDLECVAACRRLLWREAILAGASSGGIMAAVERLAETAPVGSTCAVILPDRGERYLGTVFSDAWVESSFGAEQAGGILRVR